MTLNNMDKITTTLAVAGTIALGAVALVPDPVDVRSLTLTDIASKQEAYKSAHGTYEQVLPENAEKYFGAKLKYPTHIDIYDGPDGPGYQIVEDVERLRFKATSSTDTEVLHQLITKEMINNIP